MWKYECVTRHEFEAIKDKIEKMIVMLGGKKVSVDLPYAQRMVSCVGNDVVENISARPAYEYNGQYYRVSEIGFSSKPFVVIQCGTYDELMKNIMEDADPFPYDLPENELLNEVKHSLEI